MKHFNVAVRYHDSKEEREMSIIIKSASVHSAMQEAMGEVERMAEFGPKWLHFEAVRGSPVEFPYVIDNRITSINKDTEPPSPPTQPRRK